MIQAGIPKQNTIVMSAEYALRVFADMVKVFIVYVILLIGVLIIAGIIDSLFLNGSSYQYLLESAAAIMVTKSAYPQRLLFSENRFYKEGCRRKKRHCSHRRIFMK